MKALLLIVGLYRAPYAWEVSRSKLIRTNTSVHWDTILVIDRKPYCKHENIRVIIVKTSTFLLRLNLAYKLVDWSHYEHAVVSRPDVMLTRAIDIGKICADMRTNYIISGDSVRNYIFHNRDWDFGYVVCDSQLFHSFTINNLTKATVPQISLDFQGCWNHTCKNNWRYPYIK